MSTLVNHSLAKSYHFGMSASEVEMPVRVGMLTGDAAIDVQPIHPNHLVAACDAQVLNEVSDPSAPVERREGYRLLRKDGLAKRDSYNNIQKLNSSFFKDSVINLASGRANNQYFIAASSSDISSAAASATLYAAPESSTLETTTLPEEKQWTHRIENALQQDLFFLYYQEARSVDEKGETIREVLIRFPDEKTGEILLPQEFLPAAKSAELMSDIDFWVIRRCFQEIEGTELANTLYSINLSEYGLNNLGFIDFIESALKDFAVEPSHICFEIRETAALLDLQVTTKVLLHLKDLGFRLALDNFGQGMSSMGYLKQLPVDFLKVDGSLVSSIASNQRTWRTLELIDHLGDEMGMATIASHVSSSAIAEAASKLNFDYLQGFIISEPKPFVLL